jgi:RNA polymerase sigma-70 factor (ECF subfamily)
MTDSIDSQRGADPQQLYEDAAKQYGAALVRLARSYQPDPDLQQDLLQEIHLALWRSLPRFNGRCSLRTWVYRVAHNAAATHLVKDKNRRWRQLVSLDAIDPLSASAGATEEPERRLELDELAALVQQLKPLDRQIMILYLEGLDAASTAEIVGTSPGNIATKVHRIKKILADRARTGGQHGR